MLTTSIISAFQSKAGSSARECVHLVTRGHFWSRDKDGGHTIRSTVVESPVLHANLMALCCIEPASCTIQVYVARIGILDAFGSFDLDLDLMTFIDLTRIVWRYIGDLQI